MSKSTNSQSKGSHKPVIHWSFYLGFFGIGAGIFKAVLDGDATPLIGAVIVSLPFVAYGIWRYSEDNSDSFSGSDLDAQERELDRRERELQLKLRRKQIEEMESKITNDL